MRPRLPSSLVARPLAPSAANATLPSILRSLTDHQQHGPHRQCPAAREDAYPSARTAFDNKFKEERPDRYQPVIFRKLAMGASPARSHRFVFS